MIRGMFALALLGLVFMSITPASGQPLGRGKAAAQSQNAESLRLYADVRHTLGLSASELIGIDRAIKLNPGIVSAAFARLGGRTDVRRRLTNGDPRVLAELKNDLLQRAQLVAIADGRVLSAATPGVVPHAVELG